MSLFDKCRRFTTAREIMASGYYPYFVPIEASYDTEVVIRGERKIMVRMEPSLAASTQRDIILRWRRSSLCLGSFKLSTTTRMFPLASCRKCRRRTLWRRRLPRYQ